MATDKKYAYLVEKYKRYPRVPDAPWDPLIYPEDGYIPECRVCAADYASYLRSEHQETFKMTHGDYCLWHDYFLSKARDVRPGLRISGGREVFTPLPPSSTPQGSGPCYCCGRTAPLPQEAPILCPSCFSKMGEWSKTSTGKKSNLRRAP